MDAKILRDQARRRLKGRTALALTVSLVCLAAAVLAFLISDLTLYLCGVLDYESGALVPAAWTQTLPLVAGILLAVITAWLLLGSPLSLGKARWFFSLAAGWYPSVERMFYAFTKETYPRCVGLSVRLFLHRLKWYLLLSLPGLLISGADMALDETPLAGLVYSSGVFVTGIGLAVGWMINQRYYLVRYLCALFPNCTAGELIRLSVQAMKGHKFELLSLRMSFTGWFLLTVPTVGLSLMYTLPYYNTAMGLFAKTCLDLSTEKGTPLTDEQKKSENAD